MSSKRVQILRDAQYFKFCAYGFLKNLRLFEPFLILILRDQDMTFTQIGILYGIREIARNLLEIPAGIFADAFGRKRSMLFSFSAYILSFLVFYEAPSFGWFTAAFLLFSFGDAFRTGTHKAMILTYLRVKNRTDQKVHYYGHTRSWSQAGSAVSALLAGGLVILTGQFRLIFLLTIIPYLLDLINLWSYPAYLNRTVVTTDRYSWRVKIIQTVKDFWITVKNRGIRHTIVSMSIYTGYYKSVKDYLQPIIQSFVLSVPLLAGYSLQARTAMLVGAIYFIIYLSTSFTSRKSGVFADLIHHPRKALYITLAAGSMAGLLSGGSAILGWKGLAIIWFAGIYLIENLRKPIGVGWISDQLDKDVLASALSVESQAETLFAALFAVLMGRLADMAGLGVALTVISGFLLL
ncbi:MAG: MFS transporter, partial [Bacteroidales bacterium]|nr:MFS transporter [Bacteroidales bacterium]